METEDEQRVGASGSVTITRAINACVLLEFAADAVLTDPYLENHFFMRFREKIGFGVERLPRLSAIIGGHAVFDHWQPSSLRAFPYKDTTPVLVATRSMERSARRAGFEHVLVVEWGETHTLASGLSIEVVPAQRSGGFKANSYVLNSRGLRVFIGTEARDVAPLIRYRESAACAHIALLPIDGSSLCGQKLVMDAQDALEAAGILGADVFIPIHYASKPFPFLLQTRSSLRDLDRIAPDADELKVICLETGESWRYGGSTHDAGRSSGDDDSQSRLRHACAELRCKPA